MRPEHHRETPHFASTFAAFVSVDPVGPADFWAEAHAAEQRRDRLVAGWTRSTALLMAAASVLVAVDLLVALIL